MYTLDGNVLDTPFDIIAKLMAELESCIQKLLRERCNFMMLTGLLMYCIYSLSSVVARYMIVPAIIDLYNLKQG